MADNKIPISLENLPDYLKSARQNGGSDDCLIDMGQVSEPRRNWLKPTLYAMTFCSLFVIGGFAYNSMALKEYTVVVNLEPSQKISDVFLDADSQILAVEQKEDSTYEVKVSTRKSRRSFIEWLSKNKNVQKAE